MEESANAIRCPNCHSIPDSRTDVPTESDKPYIRMLFDCHCGHSWTVQRFKEEWE